MNKFVASVFSFCARRPLLAALISSVLMTVSVAGEVAFLQTHYSAEVKRFGAVIDNTIAATLNASGLDIKNHKILNVTNGTASSDGAAFGQIPTAATATPAALGTAAVGSGTTWAKADHVHAMPRLDQVLAPTASVAMNSQLLTGLLDPVSAQDGATKNYIDTRSRMLGYWGALSAPGATGNKYWSFGGMRDVGNRTTAESCNMVLPIAGTLTGMYVLISGTALTTDTLAITADVNGATTAITCTVAANGTSCNDTAHTAAFSAGDKLCIQAVQSSTQAQAALGASVAVTYKSP